MSQDIAKQLAELPNHSRFVLVNRWQELFGRPAPSKLRKELLVRILAYRIQERAFGGLTLAARTRLRRLAKVFTANPQAVLPDVPIIRPGTRLVRTWRGQVHQVTVGGKGYEYKNRRYGTLSEIARLITGTRWSGPAFFGLKRRKEVQANGS